MIKKVLLAGCIIVFSSPLLAEDLCGFLTYEKLENYNELGFVYVVRDEPNNWTFIISQSAGHSSALRATVENNDYDKSPEGPEVCLANGKTTKTGIAGDEIVHTFENLDIL